MENIVDDKLPLIFKIMDKLSSKNFIGTPTRTYFKSMYELYEVLNGKNGSKQKIISDLKEFGVVGEDEEGVYYDTNIAKKLIKSSSLVDLAKGHGLGDIFA